MIQCKIHDLDNNTYHGAILLDNGDAICGCCGGLLEANDIGDLWEIVETYENWTDLTSAICGE